ncbi:molybdopterin converting factor subunit 1 [Bacillus carboniphilus]|uniref:Molybdopterin synthase sulfur carrier subunit n=1 Tax=Bacillus carboniphilus TaxID=86663 RepID=A0ABY9JU97_9BACI|nr:molybdopterin converting factor subunit 1 [Bacillus carboniphilus]WLR42374.1 molybdopterin converting factor subunit 1 [Bacillus carboniphilus]
MIKVLLFAHLQEQIGSSHITIKESFSNVKEIKEYLINKYNLPHLNGVMVAKNEEYAFDDTKVNSGDVIAFIPPVSGG